MDPIIRIWEQATTVRAVPDAELVLATGAVALLLVAAPASWPRVRILLTVVHEAGHALVAVLAGRRLHAIRLHSDTSGVTVTRGRPRGAGMIATLLAGYLAPALLGLGAAALLAAGRPLALLWLLAGAAVLMLVWVRNGYGLAVVLVVAAGLAAVSWYGAPAVVAGAAYLVAWVLLLAAPRPLLELLAAGRRGRRGSDPDQLARLTRVPAVVWVLLLLAANLGGLVLGVGTLAPALL